MGGKASLHTVAKESPSEKHYVRRSQPSAYAGDEHFWQRKQQLESQEMEMNLTSSRNRKKAQVTGVEETQGSLGWPGRERGGGESRRCRQGASSCVDLHRFGVLF